MTIYYNGQKVIDIDRNLLNTNGARQYTKVEIEENAKIYLTGKKISANFKRQRL